MTRHAVVVLICIAFVGWTVANDPGIPEARPMTTATWPWWVPTITTTPDWQAIALHNRALGESWLATAQHLETAVARETANPCVRRRHTLYLPVVMP